MTMMICTYEEEWSCVKHVACRQIDKRPFVLCVTADRMSSLERKREERDAMRKEAVWKARCSSSDDTRVSHIIKFGRRPCIDRYFLFGFR